MNNEMSGSLLRVSGSNAWKGGELTNGFLMRNADGRVAAITQSGTLDLTGNSALPNAAPFGNGLVRVLGNAVTPSSVNALKSGVPETEIYAFAGIIKYEPGWAVSHPAQNWGIPSFSKFTCITRGIVGFKFSQKSGQSAANYLAFIMGDKSKVTAIDTYDDWMKTLAAANTIGQNLYLLINQLTGFPQVVLGVANRASVSIPAGYMLVGEAVVFEPENGMIGFELDGNVLYGAAASTVAGQYEVIYDGNTPTTGVVPVDSTIYLAGQTAIAKANVGNLTKTALTFSGWNTLANGTGTNYAVGASIPIVAADVTLYAKWV